MSGSPASLAAGASVDCVFDLGPDWRQYTLVCVTVTSTAPAAQFASVFMVGSDTTANNSSRRLGPAFSNAAGSWFVTTFTSASGAAEMHTRPKGRYLLVRINNEATNPQGSASKVTLTAFPS
ncbi:hypothetical protein ACS5PN_03795 [Roseateles sp. NT4]|uniref:hypothetical protein n=1 Tax=Roseateles sp. NT4 TaxID=3453715 RepID=UPI003EED272B